MRCKIVFEDQEILVVHKPAGLATQSSGVGQTDVVSELKNYLAKSGKAPYLGVVHRLDQPVEGLLVFAKTKVAAARLTKELQAGLLNKTYRAAVYGRPPVSEGRLKDFLWKEGNVARIAVDNEKECVGAKEAVLSYRVLRADVDTTLLEVWIETGRFHQIRAQLAHAGFPILGDQKYGNEASIALSQEKNIRNVALLACDLEFRHPTTKKKMHWDISPEQILFQK